MKCPVDDTVLAISERRGIEIDYCPQCRGVWLDRGELDKLLDRAADEFPEPYQQPQEQLRDDRRRDHGGHGDHAGHRKKKRSFLSEFLEFGD